MSFERDETADRHQRLSSGGVDFETFMRALLQVRWPPDASDEKCQPEPS